MTAKKLVFDLWDRLQPRTQFSAWMMLEEFLPGSITRKSSEVYFSHWKKRNRDADSRTE